MTFIYKLGRTDRGSHNTSHSFYIVDDEDTGLTHALVDKFNLCMRVQPKDPVSSLYYKFYQKSRPLELKIIDCDGNPTLPARYAILDRACSEQTSVELAQYINHVIWAYDNVNPGIVKNMNGYVLGLFDERCERFPIRGMFDTDFGWYYLLTQINKQIEEWINCFVLHKLNDTSLYTHISKSMTEKRKALRYANFLAIVDRIGVCQCCDPKVLFELKKSVYEDWNYILPINETDVKEDDLFYVLMNAGDLYFRQLMLPNDPIIH